LPNILAISIPSSVPGGIYSDLSQAGNIFQSDIYYRYNDLETKWVGRSNWTFSRSFEGNHQVIPKLVKAQYYDEWKAILEFKTGQPYLLNFRFNFLLKLLMKMYN